MQIRHTRVLRNARYVKFQFIAGVYARLNINTKQPIFGYSDQCTFSLKSESEIQIFLVASKGSIQPIFSLHTYLHSYEES